MKTFFNWWFFIMIVAFCYCAYRWVRLPSIPERGTMSGIQVIIFALSFAFIWVEVLKWWKHVKPFNCLKCMTGWTALMFAFTFHVEFWYMYLFVGLFVGAVFEGIKMRWL
jgi:hypothetical protein